MVDCARVGPLAQFGASWIQGSVHLASALRPRASSQVNECHATLSLWSFQFKKKVYCGTKLTPNLHREVRREEARELKSEIGDFNIIESFYNFF